MTGNVAEWSDDIPYYYPPTNGTDPSASPLTVLARHFGDPFYPGGINSMAVRGGSYESGSGELRLDRISSEFFNAANPTTGLRCVIPATDLETVASNYQPFSALYGEYGYFYHPRYYDPYQFWWYTIYLRYLQNASRP